MSSVTPRGNSWVLGLFVHSQVDEGDLDVYEFRVYAHLCRRAGDEMRVWEGQKKIAEHCKISRASVQRALYSLKEKGWIELHEKIVEGAQRPNDIILLGPPRLTATATPPPPTEAPPPLRDAPPASDRGTVSKSIEVNPKKERKAPQKARQPNPLFDALVAALYPQGAGSNSSYIAKVASSLSGAGWTSEEVAHVVTWRKRDPWWQKKVTLSAFEKNAEDWKRDSGVAARRESGAARENPEDITEALF